MEQTEFLYIADGFAKWYNYSAELFTSFLLLGIYPKDIKTYVRKNIYRDMFTEVLFMIAPNGRQLNVHQITWKNKLWYKHTIKYSAVKRNKLLMVVKHMNLMLF